MTCDSHTSLQHLSNSCDLSSIISDPREEEVMDEIECPIQLSELGDGKWQLYAMEGKRCLWSRVSP